MNCETCDHTNEEHADEAAGSAIVCDCRGSYSNGTSHTDRCLTKQWSARKAAAWWDQQQRPCRLSDCDCTNLVLDPTPGEPWEVTR